MATLRKTLSYTALVSWMLASGFAGTAHAGHPLGTEDAETKGKGNAEVEFTFEQSRGGVGSRDTALGSNWTLGIFDKIDLAAAFTHHTLEPEEGTGKVRGMGDTDVTLKAALLDGKGWKPTVGLKAGARLPTGDPAKGLGDGRASGLLTLISDWEAGNVLVHLNLGATIAGRPVGSRDRDDRTRASLVSEWEVRKSWYFVSEYLWEKNIGASGPAASDLLAGGKKKVSERFSIDAAIRWGTTSASPNVTYLAGITFAFQGDKPHGEHDHGPGR